MRWIRDEHAATGERFEQGVVERVPQDRWRDPAGEGGSSLAWLMFHAAAHEDIAVNAVLRGEEPMLAGWRDRLGLAGLPDDVGLGETEVPAASATLDLDVLVDYARAVPAATAGWLADLEADQLDGQADGAAGLRRAGVEEAAAPWLYRMWRDRPVAWFVQWEAVGHRLNHVGEMVSVRNRLGLSPF